MQASMVKVGRVALSGAKPGNAPIGAVASAAAARPGGLAASGVLDACAKDVYFWSELVRSEEILAFLSQVLRVEVLQNAELAKQVLKVGLAVTSAAAALAAREVDETALELKTNTKLAKPFADALDTNAAPCCAPSGTMMRATLAVPAGNLRCCQSSRLPCSGNASFDTSIPTPAVASAAAVHGSTRARRSLADAFDAEVGGNADVHATPAKQRRCPKICNATILCSLPAPVMVQVVGFLPLCQTVHLNEVARGLEPVFDHGEAWEPLILDRTQSAGLLRRLRELDPVGALEPKQIPMPMGLFRVTEMCVDLMEPDRLDPDADDEEVSSPTARLVLDPLEELCRRFRRSFKMVDTLKVSNVEDHRLDYRYLHLRGSVFCDFSYVRLVPSEFREGGPSPVKYSMTALRHPRKGLAGPPDIQKAAMKSEARHPRNSPLLLEPAEALSVEEAMFLEEHTAVFKSGDLFHVCHAPWRTFSCESIQRRYRGLLGCEANAATM